MKNIIYIFTMFTCTSLFGETCKDQVCDIKVLYKHIISTTAKSLGVPEKLMVAVCTVESGLRSHPLNWSKAGTPSVGLCQIEPNTARLNGYKGDYKGLLDPKVNVYYATKHMARLISKYKNEDHALAAYNLGHLKFNSKGEIWNRGYVAKVRKVMQ